MRLTAASLFVLCLSVAVAAQEPPKVEETLVVTATRSSREVSELPVSTTVIPEKEIRSAPVLWADDLLRNIPGVHMHLSGTASTISSTQRLSMHGLGGTRALVLLDGIPMHDPFFGTVQWQKLPVDTLRQVEVVRGGNASLFGSGALGGTINLITRPAQSDVVRADLSYGSMSTGRRMLSVEQKIGSTLGLRVSHNAFESDGSIRVPNPGPIDHPGWNDTRHTSLRLDYEPTESLRTFLKANHADIQLSEGTLAWNDRDMLEVAAGAQKIFGSNTLLSLTAYAQKQEEYRLSSSVTATRTSEYLSNVSTIPVDAAGASVEWSMHRQGALSFVSLGLDVQQIDATESRQGYNRSGVMTIDAVVEGHQEFAGAFGQVSWRPSDTLEILTSVRLDHFDNSAGRESVAGGATTEFPAASSTQLDPRISFRKALGERAALRGAVYRAFKAPTLRDLYRSQQTGSTVIVANPYLEPETLVGGEVGVEWSNRRVRVEANVYRSDVDGLTARSPVPGQPANVYQPMNLGSSRSQGVEVMANVQVTPSVTLDLGYTWADSKVVEDPEPELVGKLVPDVAPHIGTFGIRWRSPRGSSVDLRGRILSRSYGETRNVVPSPAHRVFDIGVVHPVGSRIDVYAMLENALDEEYFYVLTPQAFRSAQPRSLTAGVRLSIPAGGRTAP